MWEDECLSLLWPCLGNSRYGKCQERREMVDHPRDYLSPDLTCHAQGLPSYNGIWWSIKRLRIRRGSQAGSEKLILKGETACGGRGQVGTSEMNPLLSSGCPGPYPASVFICET